MWITNGGTWRRERIYLGGFEIWRRYTLVSGNWVLQDERETVHVSDDHRRICMIESLTWDDGDEIADIDVVPRRRFQFDNHLGTACVETDQSGAVISYEEYHPYGTSSYRSWNGSAEVSAKRYRYTGKERDEETSLYYHGARYYAPWLGRWMSADPAGTVDGSNLFAYVRGSPVVLSDPSGTTVVPPEENPKLGTGINPDLLRNVREAATRKAAVDRPVVSPATKDKLTAAKRDAQEAVRTIRAKANRGTSETLSRDPAPGGPQKVKQLGGGASGGSLEGVKNQLLGASYGFFEAQPLLKDALVAADLLPEKPPEELAGNADFEQARENTRAATTVAQLHGVGAAGSSGGIAQTTTGGTAVVGVEGAAVATGTIGAVGVAGQAGEGVSDISLSTGGAREQPRNAKGEWEKKRPGDAPPGQPAEKTVKDQLEAEGNTIVGSRVTVRTPLGNRVLDHVIQTPEGKFVGVEVKSGGATKSFGQILKDKIISGAGGVFTGKNAPDALRGKLEAIDIITRRVP